MTYVVTAPTSSQNAAGARGIGEQRPALQPGGELRLEAEADTERRVAEDIMDDPELVDDAAFGAAGEGMRVVTRARRERHRSLVAKLVAELRGTAVGSLSLRMYSTGGREVVYLASALALGPGEAILATGDRDLSNAPWATVLRSPL